MLYRNFSSQLELDAHYDVERAVPDFESFLTKFATGSEAVRSSSPQHLDVSFGPTVDERLDLFPAEKSAGDRPPIVVFVHGGYWRMSDGRDYSFVASGLSSTAALSVVNYTLAPKAPLSEIVRQVRAAIAWTWSNAERIGGDRDRLYVVGHSAGAHLTVMSALTDWAGDYGLPSDIVKGAFAISGLYDLRPLPYTFVSPALQLTGRDILTLSPVLLDLPEDAPSLRVAYGADETTEFIRQSESLVAHWQRSGLIAKPIVMTRRDHFSIVLDLADPNSNVVREIADFIWAGR